MGQRHRNRYITGEWVPAHGEAFTFDYDLPNDTRIGRALPLLVFFAWRMLQIRPKAEY